jgi:hypothetical protein
MKGVGRIYQQTLIDTYSKIGFAKLYDLSTQPSFRAIFGKEDAPMGRTLTASRPQKRDAATKLAHARLSVLELARELGNVAETCRQRGLDRTGFYEWKRRFQTQGFEGLKDLPPIHKSHP